MCVHVCVCVQKYMYVRVSLVSMYFVIHVYYVGCLSGQYDEDFDPSTDLDGDDHSPVDELALSFEDIGTLRKSLEDSLRDSYHSKSADSENSSDYDSCTEELDSTDEISPSTSPLPQFKENGIMLEFESQPRSTMSLSSRPSTVKQVNPKQKPIDTPSHEVIDNTQGVHESQVSLKTAPLSPLRSSVLNSTTHHPIQTQAGAPMMTNSQNTRLVHLANRSLSATRKKQNLSLDEDHESTQAVLDAVSLENKALGAKVDEPSPAVTNLDPGSPSLVLGQISKLVSKDSSSGVQAPPTTDVDDQQYNIDNRSKVASRMATDQQVYDHTGTVSKTSKGENLSKGFGSPISSSPFKPVLVSRYKSHSQTKSPRERDPDSTHDPAPPHGGSEGERESLTEHTLSVITAKVREMDAR